MPSGKKHNAFAKIINLCQPVELRRLTWVETFPCLVSSPEHNVLRASYCDRSMFGIRPSVRPSVCPSVRKQLLKESSPLKPAYRFQ